jgi:uncharacterized protein (TIGR00369 family)
VPAIHGGVLGGFLETAGILNLIFEAELRSIPKVINISIDYLRPGLNLDTYAQSTVIKQGKNVANISVSAYQETKDKPIAVARMHCLIV